MSDASIVNRSLAAADIGIAMGGADVALETADAASEESNR